MAIEMSKAGHLLPEAGDQVFCLASTSRTGLWQRRVWVVMARVNHG